MTDKELLELAAKAAGIVCGNWDGSLGMYVNDPYLRLWNPLTNDGDALRLAVKLNRLNIFMYPDEVAVYGPEEGFLCKHEANPYAATRRAIVRAAAEIGKGMK